MSILDHLDSNYRYQRKSAEDIPKYKERCCMKYTVEDMQCKRCPFRQIEDQEAQEQAMLKCRDKRRGTHKHEELEIEFNNQYL